MSYPLHPLKRLDKDKELKKCVQLAVKEKTLKDEQKLNLEWLCI